MSTSTHMHALHMHARTRVHGKHAPTYACMPYMHICMLLGGRTVMYCQKKVRTFLELEQRTNILKFSSKGTYVLIAFDDALSYLLSNS